MTLKYLFELNRSLDKVSFYWALGVLILGVFAMVRARNITQTMQRINNPFENWWNKKGFTPRQLEDEMTLYVRLFSGVWISCGLFWTYWVLFHKY